MTNNYPIAAHLEAHPEEKPSCTLIGMDGNIYNLLGIANRALKGIPGAASELTMRVKSAGDYTEALSYFMDYLNVN